MRIGIYTKQESRLERQRAEDDYKAWHGDPGPVDVSQYVAQERSDRFLAHVEQQRKDLGLTAEVLHNEYRQGFLDKNGTHIDVALREFSPEILAEYPFVHCYRITWGGFPGVYNYVRESFNSIEQVCPADPHFTWQDILIARKNTRSLSLDEVINGDFPEGTFFSMSENLEHHFPKYLGMMLETKIKLED